MTKKIFCDIDDFMQEFEEDYKINSKLSMSEIITILVYFI